VATVLEVAPRVMSSYRRERPAERLHQGFASVGFGLAQQPALSDDLVEVVRETMQPSHVSLWLRPDSASKGEQAE
jgi:hypothetical protein